MIIVTLIAIGQEHTYPSREAFNQSQDAAHLKATPDAIMFMQITEV